VLISLKYFQPGALAKLQNRAGERRPLFLVTIRDTIPGHSVLQ
jgi:hypothetical protein